MTEFAGKYGMEDHLGSGEPSGWSDNEEEEVEEDEDEDFDDLPNI